jgi:hypothetical protein
MGPFFARASPARPAWLFSLPWPPKEVDLGKRATAATNALDHQHDVAKVKEWLGLANIATSASRITVRPDPRTVRHSHELLSQRFGKLNVLYVALSRKVPTPFSPGP